MTHCAGCKPLENQTQVSRVPSCLEPIVFPGASRVIANTRFRASYQCLACNRIWTFDEQRGFQSQLWTRQAA